MKIRYRFTGRSGDRYCWESVLPVSAGDSRHERVSCPVGRFWSPPDPDDVPRDPLAPARLRINWRDRPGQAGQE